MVLVQLGDDEVRYFQSLEAVDPWTHHSVHPDEVSGALSVTRVGDRYQVRLAQILTGHRTDSAVPPGSISFHTHNVPPGDVYHQHLSTDVPSWQDFRAIALASVQHGLQDHLVFTPNYTYVVSVSPTLLRNLHEQARQSRNSLETFVTAKTQARYTALVNRAGANDGPNFVASWLAEMRQVGFEIEQRRQGESVSFNYNGPLPGKTPTAPAVPVAPIAIAVLLTVLLIGLVWYLLWE